MLAETRPSVQRRQSPAPSAGVMPEWWAPLFDQVEDATVYLSPEWMQTWRDVYGAPFAESWIRWEDEDGRVVGGCLLTRHRVRRHGIPMDTVFVNATGELDERVPLVEFNDVLAIPAHRDAVAADFARCLAAIPWDCLVLSGYESHSVIGRAVGSLPAAEVRIEPRPAPYAAFGESMNGDVLANVSRSSASQIRRSHRLYESASGPITFRVAATVEEALLDLDRLAALHAIRWQAKGQEGSFGTPARMEFQRRLIRRMWPRGWIEMARIAAGEREIGYLYNFNARGKVYSFQSGLAYEADPKFKPGLVSHVLAMRDALGRGLREYDFLAGESRYKRTLAKQERTLHWTVAYRDRAWIRLLAWGWKIRNRMRERAAA